MQASCTVSIKCFCLPDKDEPISIKKLKQGDGKWAKSKEIQGWFSDGTSRCMSLPTNKVKKITDNLKSLVKQKLVKLGKLEKVTRKLMQATIRIPNGWGLLLPIIAMVATKSKLCNYKDKKDETEPSNATGSSGLDPDATNGIKNPTPCADLLPAPADYGSFCDTSKEGASGVWFGLSKSMPPVIWCVKFPPEIKAELVSQKKPKGMISN